MSDAVIDDPSVCWRCTRPGHIADAEGVVDPALGLCARCILEMRDPDYRRRFDPPVLESRWIVD